METAPHSSQGSENPPVRMEFKPSRLDKVIATLRYLGVLPTPKLPAEVIDLEEFRQSKKSE